MLAEDSSRQRTPKDRLTQMFQTGPNIPTCRMFPYTPNSQICRWLLKIPFFGRMFLQSAVARLSMTLSTLLSNGLPLTDALEIATGTLGNAVLEDGCQRARKEVMNGSSLAESLGRIEELPRLLPRMVRVGEEAGTLSSMLEDVSSYYDQEVETSVKAATSLIEPIMIAIMGVVVGTIGLALLLPIFSLSKQP